MNLSKKIQSMVAALLFLGLSASFVRAATGLRPVGDQVLVKPMEPVEEKMKLTEGEIRAVSRLLGAAGLKVGDRVLLDKKVGTKVNLDGEILLFVHVDDILAVFGV